MSFYGELSLAIIAFVLVAAAVAGAIAWILEGLKDREKRKISPPLAQLVADHIKPLNSRDMIVVGRKFPKRARVDLALALERLIARDFSAQLFTGIRAKYSIDEVSIGSISSNQDGDLQSVSPEYEDIDIGNAAPTRCLTNGLWFLTRDAMKFVVVMSPPGRYEDPPRLHLEIGHSPEDASKRVAEGIFKELETAISNAGSYRGKALSLEKEESYSGQSKGITVHAIRAVAREQIILPQETLDLLDRNILRFVEHRDKLVKFNMSQQKGLLFYGPPGTGKTHTVHYLKQVLQNHTFLLIAAEQQAFISEYMVLARLLQPSVVVIEDADLIARNREDAGPCSESLLNKLLNEMDGLRPDSQIIFVLTTNRPETLEEALTSRPGRIDQAIEFPMPDADCRLRLFKLYLNSVKCSQDLLQDQVARTDGVSAAFIKELVRRTVQFGIEGGRDGEVLSKDFEDALDELLHSGGSINVKLLGGKMGLRKNSVLKD